MKTNKLIFILSSSFDEVRKTVTSEGFSFYVFHSNPFKIYKKFEPRKKIVYGFTSLNSALPVLHLLKKPPIIWDSIVNIRKARLRFPIIILDGFVSVNGIVDFYFLDKNKLSFLIKKKYKYVDSYFNSDLDKILEKFLDTLPEYIHEPFLLVLGKSLKDRNFYELNKFIFDNRVSTTENKKELSELSKYLDCMIKEYKDFKVKIKDSKYEKSRKKIISLINKLDVDRLEKYKDIEGCVNICNLSF